MTQVKTCTKCQVDQPLENFWNEKRGKFGKQAKCKRCVALIQKEYWNIPGKKEALAERQKQSYIARRDEKRAIEGWQPPQPIVEKRCGMCSVTKPLADFHAHKNGGGGVGARCKECARKVSREWREMNKERSRQRFVDFMSRNPEKAAEYAAAHWRRNKDNALYRLTAWMRTAIRRSLLSKNGRRTFEIFGFTSDELRIHLEKQFLPGMSWENFGKWHIDHVQPISSFCISGPDDPGIRSAWGLPNLRPLWAADNLKKRDKRTHLL
ncbi:hypothetical protein [Delftia acidovorans]|uniref:HNH endonuclease n=1 Tax=Delftia acidovorans TaxID=80866 RepID=A0AAJ2VC12_DELAC|nr:hypothetical protein [Delftia acidovorans]MDX4957930.1 hypothetical protein [Delftia acidovorans]